MLEKQSLENPLVIIGDEDFISGFRALGFRAYAGDNNVDLAVLFDEMIKNKPAICLVEESFYNILRERINSLRNLPLPIFIPLAKNAKTDFLDDMVKDIRLRAIGTLSRT